jgi:Protein of unknown function (DUF4446)
VSRTDLALVVGGVGCALAVLLAIVTLVLWMRVRRMRRGQKLLLGADQQDLVEYAVGLLARVEQVEARAAQVDGRVAQVVERLDGCLQRWSLLRYDALEGAGGRQSVSMAMLDSASNGVVLTAIQDREYARIYVKQITAGKSDLELSPEERRALEQAQTTGR